MQSKLCLTMRSSAIRHNRLHRPQIGCVIAQVQLDIGRADLYAVLYRRLLSNGMRHQASCMTSSSSLICARSWPSPNSLSKSSSSLPARSPSMSESLSSLSMTSPLASTFN